MADVLQGIEENVPFDHGAADRLIAACRATAGVIDEQRGPRSSWTSTAMTQFRGRFSRLFQANCDVERGDATELRGRLLELAAGAERLQAEARKEQQRRDTARAWKRDQDQRNVFETLRDRITGGEQPPVGPAAEPITLPTQSFTPGRRETPAPGAGGASGAAVGGGQGGGQGGGTTSARPADLRAFAKNATGANQQLRARKTQGDAAYQEFTQRCRWGTLSAEGVLTGFGRYLAANDEDVRWAGTVADAFARAGGEGTVTTLADSGIAASLAARGVRAARTDLAIDPPQALGHPPTTGYANDPVNTAPATSSRPRSTWRSTGATPPLRSPERTTRATRGAGRSVPDGRAGPTCGCASTTTALAAPCPRAASCASRGRAPVGDAPSARTSGWNRSTSPTTTRTPVAGVLGARDGR